MVTGYPMGSPLYPPPPSNLISLQGNQDLFFAGTSHGTFHVSPEGSLSIQGKSATFPAVPPPDSHCTVGK